MLARLHLSLNLCPLALQAQNLDFAISSLFMQQSRIELYLGRDILEEEAGKLCPVRYSGFVPTMSRWQGEITKKQKLQNKYLRLLNDIAENPAIEDGHDWSGIDAILQTIFKLYTEISNEVFRGQENSE